MISKVSVHDHLALLLLRLSMLRQNMTVGAWDNQNGSPQGRQETRHRKGPGARHAFEMYISSNQASFPNNAIKLCTH
jgi:hypothetical protein